MTEENRTAIIVATTAVLLTVVITVTSLLDKSSMRECVTKAVAAGASAASAKEACK